MIKRFPVASVLAAGFGLVMMGLGTTDAKGEEIWRSIATPQDVMRFDRMSETRADALKLAVLAPAFSSVRAVVEGDGLPVRLHELNGEWECRTIKIGGFTALVVYDFFHCVIFGRIVEKLTGSQNFSGRLVESPEGIVFLGTSHYGDEKPIPYGQDADRNIIGLLRAFGPDHLALDFPSPRYESLHDVIESVRKRPPQGPSPFDRQTLR
jgi:hypothetical protein